QTQVEPDTFAFGSTIVSAFQTGRYFNGGASNIGWATSISQGVTWVHGFLPGTTDKATPRGLYERTSDPSVAYDDKHKAWLISWLGISPSTVTPGSLKVDVLVSRSIDGGLRWGAPVLVFSTGPASNLDKNWTVCDDMASSRFYGNCYTEF